MSLYRYSLAAAEPPKSWEQLADEYHSMLAQTHRKRAWRVPCCCPACSPIQPKALVTDDLDNSTASEGFWVRLSLDLQNVKWKEDDFSYANKTARRQHRNVIDYSTNSPSRAGMHHCLAMSFPECTIEGISMILGQVISYERLATIFIYSLQNLLEH